MLYAHFGYQSFVRDILQIFSPIPWLVLILLVLSSEERHLSILSSNLSFFCFINHSICIQFEKLLTIPRSPFISSKFYLSLLNTRRPLRFPLSVQHVGKFLHVVIWNNVKAYLICFPYLEDKSFLLPTAQSLECHYLHILSSFFVV
jgi:hypothetical protein